MASLPNHSAHLQQQHHIQLQQRQSPHQLYQHGNSNSPDFDDTSPNHQGQLHHTSGSDTSQFRQGGGDLEVEENSEWGLTKAGKRRQRLPLACQVCRKKKVPQFYFDEMKYLTSM
jgi:hypothetical protein